MRSPTTAYDHTSIPKLQRTPYTLSIVDRTKKSEGRIRSHSQSDKLLLASRGPMPPDASAFASSDDRSSLEIKADTQ